MKCVLALSGGADSSTLLAHVVDQKRQPLCLFFDYGSKHGMWEQIAANNVARYYGVPLKVINLCDAFSLFRSNLLKQGGEIPEGHYEAETMKQTVVPARNLIFLSIMAGVAVSNECGEIWLGVHAGDHAIYPDCRPAFLQSVSLTISLAVEWQQTPFLRTPYISLFKKHIIEHGLKLKVPYQLTRTCYKNQSKACGKCGSCQERLEAFAFYNVEDPLEYESREILPKK